MKTLVTGARGQVGSELIAQGEVAGFEMLATDSADLDICQADAVSDYLEQQRPDLVINAAAHTAVDKAESEQALAYAINRDGPANLAASCKALGIPLFHISTDYVFDGEKASAYAETDLPNPQSVYGQSKLEGEQAVEQVLPEHIMLRVAWVFGKTGNNFVRTMLRLAETRDELGIVEDQRGAPTSAADIASVLLKLATSYQQQRSLAWGTYHYIGTPATTWYGFADAIFSEAVKLGLLTKAPRLNGITTEQYPTPASRPKNSVLDCRKLEETFGIRQPDWRAALSETLKYWKTHET